MKAIMLMFDSLNRNLLEPYGGANARTPNFTRLAQHSVRFDNCYAGSLPCMPARRELHTGRYNFLHRSWGPLEPFDDSVPQILKNSGVYTHLVSDHIHYWEDGGASYHNRYSSWEIERGQEGDKWKCLPELFDPEEQAKTQNQDGQYFCATRDLQRHDAVNRQFMKAEPQTSLAKTFCDGLSFLEENHGCDNWFLQIECFDPHEPFYSPGCAESSAKGEEVDWPPYHHVTEDARTQDRLKQAYVRLMERCDAYLGRLLDRMDALNLWQDTLLIVNTDHGYLLGEHGWWSKIVMPCYDEIVHIPLFVHDPRFAGMDGQNRSQIVQTVDLAATLLEYFRQPLPGDMQGRPIRPVLEKEQAIRDYAFFGIHGAHINLFDGRYVYMKAPVSQENQPLFEYTLMPMHMRNLFLTGELRRAESISGSVFPFTKGCPLWKIPKGNGSGDCDFSELLINGKNSEGARHIDNNSLTNAANFGDKLFDLQTDPHQEAEIDDLAVETRMANLLVRAMRENDSPAEQYERIGLPADRRVTENDIQELRRAGQARLVPAILPEYSWSRGAINAYRALIRFIPENRRTAASASIAAGVRAAAENGKITAAILLSQIDKIIPSEYQQMVFYFVDLASRTE